MWLYVQPYVRLQNIKLLEENTGRIFFDINYSNVFLDLSTKAKETKAKRNKWDLIKLKLLLSKGRHQQDKMTTYEAGKNICKWYDKYGVSIRNTQTTQHQKTVHLKQAEDQNRHFTKGDTQTAKRNMKRWSTSFSIWEIQSKPQWHITPHLSDNYHQKDQKSWVLLRMWRKGALGHCWWECKLVQPPWK